MAQLYSRTAFPEQSNCKEQPSTEPHSHYTPTARTFIFQFQSHLKSLPWW